MSAAEAAVPDVAPEARAREIRGTTLLRFLLRNEPGARSRAADIAAVSPWLERPQDQIAKTIARLVGQGLDAGPAAIYFAMRDDAGLQELNGLDYLEWLSLPGPAVINEADCIAHIDRLLVEIRTFPTVSGRDVRATPFQWVEPEAIPIRRPLSRLRHAFLGHVSITGAVGGCGKSTLLNAEILAHVTGRDLLDDEPLFAGVGWILALEDPLVEHQRRIAAIALLHQIRRSEIEGRLFLDTAADGDFVIARDTQDGLVVIEPIVDGIIARIREHKITYLVVDPFVACHSVRENDNGAIDKVARLWVRIAQTTSCAIELVHHLRKGNGTKGNGTTEPTADDFRGASSLVPAARSARVLSPMSNDEADRFGVDEPFRFIKVIDAKRNMSARSSEAVWRELVSVDLRNGNPSDHVAAVAAWQPPDAIGDATADQVAEVKKAILGGSWRADPRAKSWVGIAVAQVMDLDLRSPAARAQVGSAIKHWLKCGVLVVRKRQDAKQRKEFEFVEVAL